MFRIEESFDTQILKAQKDRPVVVFIEPLDARVLEAVCHLTRYVKPVLLAGEDEVRETAVRCLSHLDRSRVEYSLSECAFLKIAERPDLVEAFATDCLSHPKCRNEASDLEEARLAL